MAAYEDRYWNSADGLKLHYRDYAGGDGRPPILCLPGLTRNARDFEGVADRLAGDWRVLAIDFRGRGKSEYAKDPMGYLPTTYADDVAQLIEALGLERFALFGTSLGGLVTMLLANRFAGRIAGVLLNDVGPEIEAAGLGRIRSYVGKASVWPTWMHAARALQDANGDVYPTWEIGDWVAMAKRLYRLNSAGRIVLDYDLRIAEPLRVPGNEAAPDMWSLLDVLASVPTLLVRGGRSDVLGERTAARMMTMLKQGKLVTVPDTGHAPTLEEPEAAKAIDRLLARVAREPVAA
jgi:pimeloyl-ACP methyl ester carboxylesterase